jgi:mRNA (guanine-N7-)-methyltransferase
LKFANCKTLLNLLSLIVAVRAQLAGLLTNYAPNLLDTRGRLLPRSYDVLGNALIISFYHFIACTFLWFTFNNCLWKYTHGIFHSNAGLYTTFIFQKPDPDITPPIATPILQDASYNLDEVINYYYELFYLSVVLLL